MVLVLVQQRHGPLPILADAGDGVHHDAFPRAKPDAAADGDDRVQHVAGAVAQRADGVHRQGIGGRPPRPRKRARSVSNESPCSPLWPRTIMVCNRQGQCSSADRGRLVQRIAAVAGNSAVLTKRPWYTGCWDSERGSKRTTSA